MAKITLLEMTQNILDGLGLDAVNSIDDTEDASKVARIIRNTYRTLVAVRKFPEHERIGTLWASTDDQRPTHMTIPEDCIELGVLRYDISTAEETRQRFVKVPYVNPDEFMTKIYSRNDTNSNVQVVLDYDQDRKLFIENDKKPEFWTSFDDTHLVFDSFDSAVDDTIQQSKCTVVMLMEPTFTLKDDFIPDIHAKSFPMLENESAKAASIKVAQAIDEDAERTGRRLFIRNAWEKHKVAGGIQYPNYGRRR